jgi:uncharacterized protein (TIGR02145 family)
MLFNNYRIKSELGQGGMATVYLAEDKKFLTNVAVKVLAKEFAHNENIRKRFLAEARNMFRMSHPNIIKVTDLIEEGDTVAFVMEYIEGDTLKDYLERKGKLSNDEIKTIFTQILSAVGYVHEQGLIHRDIKPSNFMISPKGQVKLLDFGIAKNTDSNSAEYTQTGTGMQMGTPMYMSPEQITETKNVTSQSDIYSLGVVLWQMVMGQKPYDTKTLSTFQLQSKIVNEKLSLTNTIWDIIIQKATSKDSTLRFQTCDFFNNEIINSENIKENNNEINEITIINEDNTVIDLDTNYLSKNEVKIGNKIWMIENLNVDQFRNKDLIPEAKTDEEWKHAGKNKQPAWCYYDYNPVNGEKYGKLYNWFAVNDLRGLAPEGWHIPNDEEWSKLTFFLGGENVAGNKMKNLSGWANNGNGTNESLFSALPAGCKNNLNFSNIGLNAYWWSSTEFATGNIWNRFLHFDSRGIGRCLNFKENGFSVRCIKD